MHHPFWIIIIKVKYEKIVLLFLCVFLHVMFVNKNIIENSAICGA